MKLYKIKEKINNYYYINIDNYINNTEYNNIKIDLNKYYLNNNYYFNNIINNYNKISLSYKKAY